MPLEKTIESLFENKKYKTLRDVLSVTNAADIAELFAQLQVKSIPVLFRLLPKELAAATFTLMESEHQELLIKSFSDNELKEVFDELYVDDMVEIIEEMPANVVNRILINSDAQTRHIINEILKYPEDSAGSLMTIEYISLRPKMSVDEAIKRIRRTVKDKGNIYDCFVTDENRILLGRISIKTILLADHNDIIEKIMDTSPVYVTTTTDKEDMYKTMSKYDSAILPVVDEETRLVGIVTFDDAIDVMQEETTEDLERMAAIAPTDDEYFNTSDIKHAKSRIIWLLILMLGAAVTGILISSYETAFATMPILVSFIPMIMSTGGNCGAQTSTLIIRGMSVDEISPSDFFKVLWMEFRISLVISIILAILNAIRIIISYHNVILATTVSLAIVGTVIISQAIGCLLPMLAKKIKLDPAVMATPLITTLVDTASVIIFFNIANALFKF
ncbi:MAG: magnesium transporter [Clostridia bacterium]|nr:magnesium transporter [Clostridia bacterium]